MPSDTETERERESRGNVRRERNRLFFGKRSESRVLPLAAARCCSYKKRNGAENVVKRRDKSARKRDKAGEREREMEIEKRRTEAMYSIFIIETGR